MLRLQLSGDVHLRLLETGDAEELQALIVANRDRLARWMPWALDEDLEATRAFIALTRKQIADDDGFQTAIVDGARIAGVVGFHGVDWTHRSTSIGYWIGAEHEGRGLMTRAVRALVDHAFGVWRLNRVEIRAAPENARSQAVAERVGFTREGRLRQTDRVGERYLDSVVFSLLASEWEEQASATVRAIAYEIDTPHGPARAHPHPVDDPKALLVLGHGAGGGVTAPDLVLATGVANEAGIGVVLVEQPYRVAGRRSPAPAKQLDAAWLAVVEAVRGDAPLLTGGRSSGARVACRTAAEAGAAGVLCLAFPVHPPGRPEKTRLSELDGVEVPVLVVQGERDPFGMPPDAPGRTVARVTGDHGLKADRAAIRAAIGGWLAQFAGS